eukprot:TRINITY_DN15099_c0_g2_i1.p1 TRINITY_DN15099_c0_g2~~TRINITY_DN15099_c0_g2_i1.p1  ORF type:complete len:231 (+),score=79.49 TRINITY_DN15099_c0_g2_i1:157-849(+)
MSFRGRGGRGGGRFGGGRRPFLPQIRDEQGNIKKPGPPLLFPELKKDLPPLPNITEKDELLISKRRRILSFCQASPYFIEKPKKAADGVDAEIERYSDRYKPKKNIERPPLSSFLKLAESYFPAELLTQGSKRARAYKGTSLWTSQQDGSKNDLGRLERLENLEQKAQQKEEKTEGKENEKKDGEDDDEAEELQDDEEDLEEDDYNQNFGFDDDDEYLEMDEGEDEGPTY